MEASDFMKLKNWVVIGDVANETKYAYKIVNKLKKANYNVTGVSAKGDGINTLKSLSDVKHTIDAIDLCINPIKGLEYVKEANKLSIKHILIQPGAESKDIINYCNENNIIAIEACVLVQLSYMGYKI